MKRNFVILMLMVFTFFTVGATTEVAVETSEGWENLLSYIITFFGSSFGLLVMGIVYSILKKLNLQNNELAIEISDRIIAEAIKAAEKWANNQKEAPKSKDKLNKAVEFLRDLAKNEGVKKFIDAGDDYLYTKIESKLLEMEIYTNHLEKK